MKELRLETDSAFDDFMKDTGNRHLADAMARGMPSEYRTLLQLAFARGVVTGIHLGGAAAQEGFAEGQAFARAVTV